MGAAAIAADLGRRPPGWLADAAKTLADAVEADGAAWRAVSGQTG